VSVVYLAAASVHGKSLLEHLGQPSRGISPPGLPEASLPTELDHQGVSSSQTYTDVDTHPPPNPLASTSARDAVLTYAYQLYQSQRNPGATSILSATPVFNLVPAMTSLEHVYSSQLVPLLRTLRSLHPHHLPTLLLLGSVHYAMDDFTTSLSLNEEILVIDPEYVSIHISLKRMERFN
jgi:protein O-GlcNAc transferase